jgi:tetratricopeptide (TPR) repeat protein
MLALRARALLASGLAGDAVDNLRPRKALELAESGVRDWEDLLKLDPGNTIAWGNLLVSRGWKSRALQGLGRVNESLDVLRASKELDKRAGPGNSIYLAGNIAFHSGFLAAWSAETGNRKEVEAARADMHHYTEIRLKALAKGSFLLAFLPQWSDRFESIAAAALGDHATSRAKAGAMIDRLKGIKTATRGQEQMRNEALGFGYSLLAVAHYNLGDYPAAEKAIREAFEAREILPRLALDEQLETADHQATLAMTLARQGRLAEARTAVEPALALQRYLHAGGGEDVFQHEQLARTLYAAALAQPQQAPGLLAEATRVLATIPQESARRSSVVQLRAWIAEEAKKKA